MKSIIDTHTHTIASGHAYNTINEMVRSAAEKELTILGITEHAPKMPGSCSYMYFLNYRALSREKYGVKLLFGAELNILDKNGTVDLTGEVLDSIDIGIASMHTPCYQSGNEVENTQAYIKAMENPHVNIIGHPDDGRFPVDFKELVLAAKEYNVLLEVNNNSLNPNGFRQNSEGNDRKMLEHCMEYQVPIIMGSDAHVEEDVANFNRANALLKEMNFPEELVANTSEELFLAYVPFAKI